MSIIDLTGIMGDIGAPVDGFSPSYNINTADDAFGNFINHCSAPNRNSLLTITEGIRATHPESHVTPISIRSCDLVAFAHAGHAKLKYLSQHERALSERTYDPPPNRLGKGAEADGKLGDEVSFGQYEIGYKGRTHDFYVANWARTPYGGTDRYCFLLSPKSGIDADRHDSGIDELLLEASKWTSELHDEIYVFDDGCWDKNKKLWAAVQSSSWDDVIIDPAMKDTLIADVANFFDSRSLYEEYAVPWKRGIILHGIPGCGKTISIRALINTLDKRDPPVASLYVKTLQNCNGLHYAVREIFEQARKMAPCLLVFEDLDSLVTKKVRSYFLNEVDGLENNDGILMIGSTNHLDQLDPGIAKRPSRFDRKYHFKIPGERERILYCEYWKKKLQKNSNIDFDPAISDTVAKLTDGFSFAYLKELFVQTLLTIVGGRENEAEEAGVEEAAEQAKVQDDSARLAVGNGSNTSNVEDKEDGQPKKGDQKTFLAPKPSIPTVQIPDHVKNNPLMRVLHKQAIALWKEMDNTTDEEAGKKPVGPPGNAEYQMQLRMLKRANRARLGKDEDEESNDDDDEEDEDCC